MKAAKYTVRDQASLLGDVAFTASTTLAAMLKAALDVALIGRTRPSELAAFALVFPVMFLAISAGRGIYTGTASAIAGVGQIDAGLVDRRVLCSSLLASTVVGLLVAFAILLSTQLYVVVMGAAHYEHELDGYFRVWVWSIPWMFVSANVFAIARNMGFISLAGAFTLVANIVGAICSLMLIPEGGLGLGLGLRGSAWSTTITGIISTLLCLQFVAMRSRQSHRTGWRDATATTSQIGKLAVPVFLSNLLLFFMISVLTRIVAQFGQDALAAYSAIGRLEQILMSFQIAFTTVGIATLSRQFREGDVDLADAYLTRLARLMAWIALVGSLACFSMAGPISHWLLPSDGSQQIGAFYLRFLTFQVFFQGLFVLSTTTLNIARSPRAALLLSALSYCLVLPLSAWSTVATGDARLCLTILALANTASGFGSWLYLRHFVRRKRRSVSPGRELEVGP